MSEISTLIPDIQQLLTKRDWFSETLAQEFSHEVSERLQGQYKSRSETPTLRLSQMGPRCPKALWHSIHAPDEAEALPPWAEFKFSFGHIIEAAAIALAKAAGHEVTGEQDEVVVDGVKGHRDCIIDGCIVDVKSVTSVGFLKYKQGTLAENDSFGYLDQLDGYLVGSLDDPLVRVKDRAYILAVDKQLGHMALYEHTLRQTHIRDRIAYYKDIVARQQAPLCECGTVSEGKSGNVRLDVKASYNAFKHCCFPNLRTFLYSDGPKFFTKVVKVPTNQYGPLPEVDRYGKMVYH